MDTYGLGETIKDEVSGLKDADGNLIDFTGYAGWFALSRGATEDWANAPITGTIAGNDIESDGLGHLRVTYEADPAALDPDRVYTRWLKVESPSGEKRLIVQGQPVKFTANPPQNQTT